MKAWYLLAALLASFKVTASPIFGFSGVKLPVPAPDPPMEQ